MFSTVARRSLNANFGRRMMSGGHHSPEEALKEVKLWYKLTIGMVALSSVFGVYNFVAHSHDHPRTDLPYMHIRNKPYPWKCSDCNLFDLECFRECRGQGKKKDDHDEHH